MVRSLLSRASGLVLSPPAAQWIIEPPANVPFPELAARSTAQRSATVFPIRTCRFRSTLAMKEPLYEDGRAVLHKIGRSYGQVFGRGPVMNAFALTVLASASARTASGPLGRHQYGSAQPRDHPIRINVHAFAGGHFRQAGHAHDGAQNGDHETCSGGYFDVAHGDAEACGRGA